MADSVSFQVSVNGVLSLEMPVGPNAVSTEGRVEGVDPGDITFTIQALAASGLTSAPASASSVPLLPRIGAPIADENRLYHYTDGDALAKIIEHRTLRATKVGYLNDGGELQEGINLALRLIKGRVTSQDYEAASPKLIELARTLESWRSVNIFVTSLSLAGDDLSQWRSYTKLGRGYSIEFSRDMLVRDGNTGLWAVEPCVYEYDTKVNGLNALLDSFVRADESPMTINLFAAVVIRRAAAMKHASFKAEAEVRLISRFIETESIIRYRAGAHTLIPYIDISLSDEAFVGVTVGPTPYMAISIAATASMLRTFTCPRQVQGTSSSLRSWN